MKKNAEKKEKIERIQKWRKTSIFDFETPFTQAQICSSKITTVLNFQNPLVLTKHAITAEIHHSQENSQEKTLFVA